MILASFLTNNKVVSSANKPSEGVNNNLTRIAIGTQEKLAFGDITSVVGDCMGDIATGECCYRNNGYGATIGELNSFLINFSQIRIQGTRH